MNQYLLAPGDSSYITGAQQPPNFTAMGTAKCDACGPRCRRDLKGQTQPLCAEGRVSHSHLSGLAQPEVNNFS